jgi:glutamyl-tRNA synthetase
VELVTPFLSRAGLSPDSRKVAAIIRAAGDRVKVAGDILDYADFFVPDDKLTFDEKAFAKEFSRPDAAGLLEKLAGQLVELEPFDAAGLEALVQRFVAGESIKVGHIIHALRVAVTGRPVGFGLYDTLAILGRDSVQARISQALRRASERRQKCQ